MEGNRPTPVDVPGLMPTGSAWSQATVAGSFVFVSGQVAWDQAGEIVGGDSIEAQADRVFENVECALERAGSSLDRLARICVYLTDPDHIGGFRAIRDRWLDGIRPASTLIIVSALADPALLVEVDAVATT